MHLEKTAPVSCGNKCETKLCRLIPPQRIYQCNISGAMFTKNIIGIAVVYLGFYHAVIAAKSGTNPGLDIGDHGKIDIVAPVGRYRYCNSRGRLMMSFSLPIVMLGGDKALQYRDGILNYALQRVARCVFAQKCGGSNDDGQIFDRTKRAWIKLLISCLFYAVSLVSQKVICLRLLCCSLGS